MIRWFFAVLAFLVTGALSYGGWWLHGHPRAIADVDHPKLGCVSYAPYRQGQSPFQPNLVITPTQIDEDLQLLSKRFDCVRTYSVGQGLDQVPLIAKKYGMQVLLGVWIGRESKPGTNAKEIATAVKLANTPELTGAIRAIVVGNEVLLRREFTDTQMAAFIGQVRGHVPVPVTYADVWEFWLKYPKMADAVDYITVHILPFWEDEPVSVEGAIAHLHDVLAKMRAAFPGKTLFIGETGWPSAGRMREAAAPGPFNQARYIREFVLAVESENVGYNVIEAFDQPWKRVQEGTVGGNWGIFNVQRQQKFPFSGPMSENPDWQTEAAVALAIAALLLGGLLFGGYAFGTVGWIAAAVGAQIAGASLVRGWVYVREISYTDSAWAVGLISLAVAALSARLLSVSLADLATGRPAGRIRPASAAAALAWLRHPYLGAIRERGLALGVLQLLTVFGAACLSLQLTFDPRYRDFAVPLYLIPAAGFAWLILMQRRADGAAVEDATATERREERWLALFGFVSVIYTLIHEGPRNVESLGWTVVALLAFTPWLRLAWVGYKARRAAAARS
ncbi:MAG TPA: glycoside hydrolase family 17 [Alphaproteobacteria bacterium]|jgi:glucan 1,3-beta-glucosidase